MRHTTKRVRSLSAMLFLCLLLSACGNKGPLVHPGPVAASSTSAPVSASSSAQP